MKNDIFNLRRFGNYFVSDVKGCMANYGLSMALISVMGLITYALYGSMILILEGAWEGANWGTRSFAFFLCMCIMVINMPVKCYGMITDKKAGSTWLMIPASSFEKFLSMITITVIVIPMVTTGIYTLIDLFICKLDPTCGDSLIDTCKRIGSLLFEAKTESGASMEEYPAIQNFMNQLSSPWLYVDDVIMVSLTFLLGAIFFKSGKTSKTILTVIIISMAISAAATPFMSQMFMNLLADAEAAETPENLNALFSTGIFRHAALIDTINDTLINLALTTGIFFRIKTLKH